jgi:BNR/Asp-box repeat protein
MTRSQQSPRKLFHLAAAFACLFIAHRAAAQATAAPPSYPQGQALRNGRHDFDFDLGTWKTHSSRLMHPLTGSRDWADMDGITVVSKVWGGRANLAEYKAEGPAGHVELLSLRWYNPEARQWNLDFATPGVGTLGVPGVGEFRNGRGDFYDQEEINGKYVLVRFSIWAITRDTAESEQAFSEDGGKTWEVNWINKYTRLSDDAGIDWNTPADRVVQPAQHDFDFNFGTWHTHIQRILDPFSPAPASMEINGTVAVRKIWGGRAQLEEIEADGPKGHWQALTLFLYNPKSHQWSQSFINSSVGTLNQPGIGVFKDGRGELFSQDTFNNRSILVRGVWSDIKPDSHSYEESYSDDGGKTWKPAFIAHLTREKDDVHDAAKKPGR